MKDDEIRVDADYVIQEYGYSAKTFQGASDEQRVRMADLLSNRINMRRTVREFVLPCLANIENEPAFQPTTAGKDRAWAIPTATSLGTAQ
jgi:hypothetical protein